MNKQKEDAIPHLIRVSTFPEIRYQIESKWYLSLIYLQNNQKTEAVELLRWIQTKGGIHANQASALLERME